MLNHKHYLYSICMVKRVQTLRTCEMDLVLIQILVQVKFLLKSMGIT